MLGKMSIGHCNDCSNDFSHYYSNYLRQLEVESKKY